MNNQSHMREYSSQIRSDLWLDVYGRHKMLANAKNARKSRKILITSIDVGPHMGTYWTEKFLHIGTNSLDVYRHRAANGNKIKNNFPALTRYRVILLASKAPKKF